MNKLNKEDYIDLYMRKIYNCFTMNSIDTKEENYISGDEVCKIFGISSATLKNWIRLEKIKYSCKVKRNFYFDKEYIDNLKNNILSGESDTLKSRRNKKFISGNELYESYLMKDSPNIEIVKHLIQYLRNNKITLSDSDINEIIADCAKKLFQSAFFKLEYPKYEFLVQDICTNYQFINEHPEILNLQYKYNLCEDLLGLLYISLRNMSSRKSKGVYYTPDWIIEKVNSPYKKQSLYDKKILDPCCGSGNFLINFTKKINLEKIYGFDIDDLSIKITRINISLKYNINDREYLYSHFIKKDFLNCKTDEKFDLIIGNPPWGYNYSKEERKILARKFECAKYNGFDSFDVFLEQAIKMLNDGGGVNFVLPEAILNVKKHEPIRKYILENTVLDYAYFLGNVFDNVQCESIILGLIKEKGYFYKTNPYVVRNGHLHLIGGDYSFKRDISCENFFLYANDDEYKLLKKLSESSILSKKATLKDNAVFALGIVTGDNKNYLSDSFQPGYEAVLRGSNIIKYGWHPKNDIKRIKFEPKKFQQCACEGFYRAPEKLLYKFIGGKLVFAYDDLKTLCLNSCNILIPQIEGLSVKYIMAILNSRIAQFFFDKTFNSVKILRSHLEEIPIPVVSESMQAKIEELVKSIETAIISGTDYSEVYNSLDKKIAKLYRLSEKEYKIVQATVQISNHN